ncbi:MAG: DUF4372 domain-containing protein [Burkholderiaceae bacterium]
MCDRSSERTKEAGFSCLDQFFAPTLAQLTHRESLRDIKISLRAQAKRLYHWGFVDSRFRETVGQRESDTTVADLC